MLFFKLLVIFAMAFAFFKAESKYFHPRFRGMIIEKSFDETSGEIIFCALFTKTQLQIYIPDCGALTL